MIMPGHHNEFRKPKASWMIALASLGLLSAPPTQAQERPTALRFTTLGTPGMIDMPGAFSRADGELAFIVSHTPSQLRSQMTFQATDRLSLTFRYSVLENIRPSPTSAIRDKRFDQGLSLHYRVFDEGRYMPAVAFGLDDFAGNALFSREYVAASKHFSPQFRGTLGIGWGRLGSYNGFSNPLGVMSERFNTRPGRLPSQGARVNYNQWFRGPAALFAGVEWQVSDQVTLTAEYSSDDYARENAIFTRRSPFNFGATYHVSDRAAVSAQYLHGAQLGVQFSYSIDPRSARSGSGFDRAPPGILRRPDRSGTGAQLTANAPPSMPGPAMQRSIRAALEGEGLRLNGIDRDGRQLTVEIQNERYNMAAQAVGRTARVLTRMAPEDIDSFRIIISENGMPVTSVELSRTDLEELEFDVDAPAQLLANTIIADAPVGLDTPGTRAAGRYPRARIGLEPYLTPGFFDPDSPLRADVGVALTGRAEIWPGLILSGRVHQKLAGNLDGIDRPSNSPLPRVRSEASLYWKGGDTTLQELTAAHYVRLGDNLFGRATAGYLETMFGGISGEVLWLRPDSPFGLGLEVNYARQRDFNQRFGFQDYSVVTGHVSGYYAFRDGYHAQVDIGRYLAGDYGATLTLSREFDNGWRVGAFATFTNVSASDFGEGSFDKGIRLTIPLDWVSGTPSRDRTDLTLRGTQRDGGARLIVPGRLYETVRGVRATPLEATWGQFWR